MHNLLLLHGVIRRGDQETSPIDGGGRRAINQNLRVPATSTVQPKHTCILIKATGTRSHTALGFSGTGQCEDKVQRTAVAVRQRLDEMRIQGHRIGSGLGVNEDRLAGHLNALLRSADCERNVHRCGGIRPQNHVALHVSFETRGFCADLVSSRQQIVEFVRPCRGRVRVANVVGAHVSEMDFGCLNDAAAWIGDDTCYGR